MACHHPELRVLHDDIEHRCRTLTEQYPEWPCRKGCDLCCRRLAAIPTLTPPEAELLQEGLSTLPPAVRDSVRERFQQLAGPPFVCPFLDEAGGACLVYEYRPLACRTYGFYVERDQGLYCTEILERVERGDFADAVWGNACAIDDRARALGERSQCKF